MRTQSEKWFECFCKDVGINCQRIPKEQFKTPDYQLLLDTQIVIVEIKEFTPNEEEKKSDRLLIERGYGEVLSCTPGDRVRKKISDSSAQIKIKTKGIYPSILILCDVRYDRGLIAGHADPYNIKVAMYGLERIHLSVPKGFSFAPHIVGKSFGPKKKMTKNDNTSISAIGVLSTPQKNKIQLDVYHNIYAAQPLDPAFLYKFGIRQFRLKELWWEEIEGI